MKEAYTLIAAWIVAENDANWLSAQHQATCEAGAFCERNRLASEAERDAARKNSEKLFAELPADFCAAFNAATV